MRNVALFGQMASGKSAIAQALVDNGYTKVAFAEPLKAISELAYGPIDKGTTYSVNLDGYVRNVTGREILQRVGQSIKDHDRDFWLKCFLNTTNRLGSGPFVVDDGRFVFERDSLSKRGWLIVGVDTPVDVRMDRYQRAYGVLPSPTELDHPSETELPGIITNADLLVNGTDDPASSAGKILLAANDGYDWLAES